jgi:PAS domain S-box-containing protein
MLGRSLFSFMDETSKKIAIENLEHRQRVIREQHDFEFLQKDGTRLYASLETAPITDKDGNYLGAIVGVQDITDRKQAEDALRESEKEYRSLFDYMREGFAYCKMLYDEKGRPADYIYLNVNPAFDRIIGTTTVNGKAATKVFPGIKEAFPSLFEIYGRVALTGEPESFDLDFTPSGKWLHISVYSPAKEYFVAIFEDITERKAAEEAIRTIGEDLERKVTERTSDLSDVNLKLMTEIDIRLDAENHLTKTVGEKEVLLREVHHRVKNNLQIIISLINLQSRYTTDEATLSAFRESQNRIKAMALVHEKLYQSTDITKIDLDNYIRFLGNNLFQFFGMKGKGIVLTTDIRDISLAIDTAIPVGLIINELISNSLKYAFPDGRKGEISLVIHRQEHTLTLLFKDNGVGIPADFDWRNAKSLGLRLVISLVEQVQGTIELDRTAGTKFTIVVKEKE